jgi:hypothetical protein
MRCLDGEAKFMVIEPDFQQNSSACISQSPVYRTIKDCRLCCNTDLLPVLDLGELALTGVFPKSEVMPSATGPLALVRCSGCGLVQLRENFDLSLLYGENYGYRSGLNRSMVQHLESIVRDIEALVNLCPGDLVLDIGSNDGTLLGAYRDIGLRRIGIDPTGIKFKKYYKPTVELIPDFFSAGAVRAHVGDMRAKVITSVAMFYDLERPLDFVRDIVQMLAEDGIWVFEQSYLPAMLATNSYDTICHEHLEYYTLRQIVFLAERVDLEIVDVQFSEANGGSFRVTAAKGGSPFPMARQAVERILEKEQALGLDTSLPFAQLEAAMALHRKELRQLLINIRNDGKTVLGYGASTKGNVLLQYCGIDRTLLPAIVEVNQDKFGSFTPGSNIPIISEAQAMAAPPDYLLVLPWHFRDGILQRETAFLSNGGTFIFPLPTLQLVSKSIPVPSDVS